MMVMLSHARHFLVPAWESAAAFRVGGTLGVELFFVLSGFLVGSIAWNKFKNATPNQPWVLKFLARRWLRTLPNYYLFVAINALLIIYMVVPGSVRDLLPFLFFLQNLAWPHPPVFGEAWSLAVEEIFYLLLPLCLLIAGKMMPEKKTAFLTVAALLTIIPIGLRVIAVIYSEPMWDEGIRKVVIFRLDALMVGVLTSWFTYELDVLNKIKAPIFMVLALLLLGTAITIYFALDNLNNTFFVRVLLLPLISIGSALLILSGLRFTSPSTLLSKLAEVGARLSYALYLLHMPVMAVIVWSLGHAEAGDKIGSTARYVMFFLISLSIAALVERFYERKILLWRDKLVPR